MTYKVSTCNIINRFIELRRLNPFREDAIIKYIARESHQPENFIRYNIELFNYINNQ